MTGAAWAAASGIGFGLFQSVNRRAVRDIDNTYVSTFLQLAVATLVLLAASLATQDLDLLADARPWALAAFAAAGVVHFLLGWTFLNISQKRIGAARTAPLLTLTPLFGLVTAVITLGELPKAPALAAIAPMMVGAWLLSRGRADQGVRPTDAIFGIGCALMWAISPVLTVRGLEGLDSPLLGVTLGMVAAVAAFGVALAVQRTRLGLGTVAREAVTVKLLAGLLVAVATWWRWLAVADETVGVVLALSLLSVPVVLFLAPLLVGRHVEQVTLRVWAGSALVVGGALVLVLVRGS